MIGVGVVAVVVVGVVVAAGEAGLVTRAHERLRPDGRQHVRSHVVILRLDECVAVLHAELATDDLHSIAQPCPRAQCGREARVQADARTQRAQVERVRVDLVDLRLLAERCVGLLVYTLRWRRTRIGHRLFLYYLINE